MWDVGTTLCQRLVFPELPVACVTHQCNRVKQPRTTPSLFTRTLSPISIYLRKHGTRAMCWLDVGPPSVTLAQHQTNTKSDHPTPRSSGYKYWQNPVFSACPGWWASVGRHALHLVLTACRGAVFYQILPGATWSHYASKRAGTARYYALVSYGWE